MAFSTKESSPEILRKQFYRQVIEAEIARDASQKHVCWERWKGKLTPLCNQSIAAASGKRFLEHLSCELAAFLDAIEL
jgi:hypothetical protein